MLGIFLDTETNGLNPQKHTVLEIAYKILDVETGALKEEFQTIVAQPPEEWEKSDATSLGVNGFTWEKVKTGQKPAVVAEKIKESFDRQLIKRGSSVFICQNPSFDRAFFSQLIDADLQESYFWPYHWLDLASMYWAMSISKHSSGTSKLPWQTGFSKDRIAETYKLPPEPKPHRAINGVNHLLLCYETIVGFPLKN